MPPHGCSWQSDRPKGEIHESDQETSVSNFTFNLYIGHGHFAWKCLKCAVIHFRLFEMHREGHSLVFRILSKEPQRSDLCSSIKLIIYSHPPCVSALAAFPSLVFARDIMASCKRGDLNDQTLGLLLMVPMILFKVRIVSETLYGSKLHGARGTPTPSCCRFCLVFSEQ